MYTVINCGCWLPSPSLHFFFGGGPAVGVEPIPGMDLTLQPAKNGQKRIIGVEVS